MVSHRGLAAERNASGGFQNGHPRRVAHQQLGLPRIRRHGPRGRAAGPLIGKNSLFEGPFGGFFRGLGGLPVDRRAPQDLVSQITAEFARHDDFVLIIAAEGTRSFTTRWRTGFYRIALAAGVPIVCAGPDYPSRRGVFGPVIHPSGDYAADMKPAFAFFRSLRPRHPERAGFPHEAA